MAAFDTTRIVDQVTVKGALPDGYFQDQTILDIAYDVLLSEITPLIMFRREEYYVKSIDYAITANQNAYAIPDRAIGMGLREVKWISGNRNFHIERMDPRYADRSDASWLYRFYLENNNVILWPTPSNTQDTLKLSYFFRPSKLVPVSECAKITNINTSTKTLTLASLPNNWSISESFDLIKGKGGYEVIDFSLTASAVSSVSNTITFVADLPSTIAVGDYVSLAGESCFPYMPQEAQIALIHGTVVGCLESLGDPAVAVSAQKFAEQKAYLERLLSVRIEGQMKSFRTRVL
jgi:hypothetical protein